MTTVSSGVPVLDSNDGLKYVGLLSIVAIRQRLAHMPICACGTSAGAERTRSSDVDTAIDLPDLAGDLRGALHELAAKVELSFEDGSKRRCLGPFGRAGLVIQHTIRHFLAVVEYHAANFFAPSMLRNCLPRSVTFPKSVPSPFCALLIFVLRSLCGEWLPCLVFIPVLSISPDRLINQAGK